MFKKNHRNINIHLFFIYPKFLIRTLQSIIFSVIKATYSYIIQINLFLSLSKNNTNKNLPTFCAKHNFCDIPKIANIRHAILNHRISIVDLLSQ